METTPNIESAPSDEAKHLIAVGKEMAERLDLDAIEIER